MCDFGFPLALKYTFFSFIPFVCHKNPFRNINKCDANGENGINDSLHTIHIYFFSLLNSKSVVCFLVQSMWVSVCTAQTCHANSTFIKSHQTRLTNNRTTQTTFADTKWCACLQTKTIDVCKLYIHFSVQKILFLYLFDKPIDFRPSTCSRQIEET